LVPSEHQNIIGACGIVWRQHGLKDETLDSIKAKLKRGTFAATFFLAVVAALELEGVKLEDL
jgi:hypothetical protein